MTSRTPQAGADDNTDRPVRSPWWMIRVPPTLAVALWLTVFLWGWVIGLLVLR